MKSTLLHQVIAAVFAAASGVAIAQGGPGPGAGPGMGPGMGPGPGASAPGPGMRGMRGMRVDRHNTPGWAMMSRQERIDHRNKLHEMKTYDECKTYMAQHHERMVERAKDKGFAMPVQPRQDMCARLKN